MNKVLDYDGLHTGDQQEFLSLSLLQRAPAMLLICTAAQSLQCLVDHSLQLTSLLIQSLEDHRTTQQHKGKE